MSWHPLVVIGDDNPKFLARLSSELKERGLEVTVSGELPAIRRFVNEAAVDCVVLDLQMLGEQRDELAGESTGLGMDRAVLELRSVEDSLPPWNRDVPILVLTRFEGRHSEFSGVAEQLDLTVVDRDSPDLAQRILKVMQTRRRVPELVPGAFVRPDRRVRPPPEIHSLSQVPGLEALSEICEEFDVEITAAGPAARALYHAAFVEGNVPDLYRVVPLLSVIDLFHNGPDEFTPRLREAVLARVPGAECFLWDLRAATSWTRALEAAAPAAWIPANRVALGVRSSDGFRELDGGLGDIGRGRFRFIRRHEDQRPPPGSVLGSELTHALAFLQLLVELNESKSPRRHPGWHTCEEILEDCRSLEGAMALQEDASLRACVRRRLRAIRASVAAAEDWRAVVEDSGVADVVRFLDGNGAFGTRPALGELELPDLAPLVHSCRMGGDVYRLLPSTPTGESTEWRFLSEAQRGWKALDEHRHLAELLPHAIPRLAGPERVVAASPVYPVVPGVGLKRGDDEFIMFQTPVSRAAESRMRLADEESLGILLALSVQDAEGGVASNTAVHTCVLALSGCCFLRTYHGIDGSESVLLSVRLDCGRLLEVFPQLASKAAGIGRPRCGLQLFVVSRP